MTTTDRVALVTGAGRGIGRAIATALAKDGFRLALVARTGPELEEVARELELEGVDALVLPADLTHADSVKAVVQDTMERFGRLDVLVNNAGAVEGSNFLDGDLEELDQVLGVNLRATMLLSREALPHLEEGGSVIQIASIAGLRPVKSAPIYTAAKHGVVGFSESLFEQIRESGVKVSTICPGFVDTWLVAAETDERARMLTPEDVADAVLYVVGSSPRACPALITLRPQRAPFEKRG